MDHSSTLLWNWQSWNDKPFLTCRLLPLPHGFFTRQFYPLTPENLVNALSASAEVFRVKQVHSADVMTPTEIEAGIAIGASATNEKRPPLPLDLPLALPLADGIVSERANQSVWACSADCTPALVCDVATGQVAAVHAGWRGTAKKILPAAVLRMIERGSERQNLRVALGPAIEGVVYQVSEEVACKVGSTVAPEYAGDALLEYLLGTEHPPLLNDLEEGKIRLDVRRINQMQMVQIGLSVEQIAIAPHCTYQEPDKFFSYRRTQEKKVQWAGIVSQ